MRERLLQLRKELEAIAETGDESAAVVELDQSKVGRLSRMDAMQAQAMAQASGQRRTRQIREIDAALRRIEDGSYGELDETREWNKVGAIWIDNNECIRCGACYKVCPTNFLQGTSQATGYLCQTQTLSSAPRHFPI